MSPGTAAAMTKGMECLTLATGALSAFTAGRCPNGGRKTFQISVRRGFTGSPQAEDIEVLIRALNSSPAKMGQGEFVILVDLTSLEEPAQTSFQVAKWCQQYNAVPGCSMGHLRATAVLIASGVDLGISGSTLMFAAEAVSSMLASDCAFQILYDGTIEKADRFFEDHVDNAKNNGSERGGEVQEPEMKKAFGRVPSFTSMHAVVSSQSPEMRALDEPKSPEMKKSQAIEPHAPDVRPTSTSKLITVGLKPTTAVFDLEVKTIDKQPTVVIFTKPGDATIRDIDVLINFFNKLKIEDGKNWQAVYDLRNLVVPPMKLVVRLATWVKENIDKFDNLSAAAVILNDDYWGYFAKCAVYTVTSIAPPVAPFLIVHTEDEATEFLAKYRTDRVEALPSQVPNFDIEEPKKKEKDKKQEEDSKVLDLDAICAKWATEGSKVFKLEYHRDSYPCGPTVKIRALPLVPDTEDCDKLIEGLSVLLTHDDIEPFAALYDIREFVVPPMKVLYRLGLWLKEQMPLFKCRLRAAAVIIPETYWSPVLKGAVYTVTSIAPPVAPFDFVYSDSQGIEYLNKFRPPGMELKVLKTVVNGKASKRSKADDSDDEVFDNTPVYELARRKSLTESQRSAPSNKVIMIGAVALLALGFIAGRRWPRVS